MTGERYFALLDDDDGACLLLSQYRRTVQVDAGAGTGTDSGEMAFAAIAKAAPVYPPAAKRRNIEGWIKVKFLVDEQGQVDRVTVLDAEPEGIFDQAVLRCISSWRFKPGTKGGIAVKAMVEQTITFKLEG